MQKTIYILIFFLATTVAWTQIRCRGLVLSEQKIPVANASVLVKNNNDHIMYYGFTDEKGRYKISIDKEGNFVIEVNKLGFDKQQQPLKVNNSQKEYEVNFTLTETGEVLEDMVIEIDNPIQLRGAIPWYMMPKPLLPDVNRW
ncbi:hypothetical protein AS589_08105 [Empedobacter brevis]|uniref:carboxypeptidase-like regulatory domain-containing protein n=1 Tax=Empedobacter brevis TaxID=247 RepID=UPI0013204886|nr:carboxypeptidase-like regulatory domain-containing protein [Empedobacter brevis]QHC84750.1 hypothetical protein AS589_08105 [Empedobacter brevis]